MKSSDGGKFILAVLTLADEMNLNTEQFINELTILISLTNQAENTINKLSKEKQYD